VKKLVCGIALVLSNMVVLALLFRLVHFSNIFTFSILVLAPLFFTLPWVVILRKDR